MKYSNLIFSLSIKLLFLKIIHNDSMLLKFFREFLRGYVLNKLIITQVNQSDKLS